MAITPPIADRRRHPRLAAPFRLELLNTGGLAATADQNVVAAEAVDVSFGGFKVKAPCEVAVGALLSVIAYFGGAESACLCEVVWRREGDGAPLYGLRVHEWCEMAAPLKNALDDLSRGLHSRTA